MTPELLNRLIIQPVLSHLDWPQPRERAVLLTAIAIQESELKHRRQLDDVGNPTRRGRSFWQIEPETCRDCLNRCKPARVLWDELTGQFDSPDDLEQNDLAACAIAAGILRLHPGRLPWVGDHLGAWGYYFGSWRPGRPRRESWDKAYSEAMGARST